MTIEPEASEATREAIQNDAILRQRALYYSQSQVETKHDCLEAILFIRGQSKYAIPIHYFREVKPLPQFCKIPGASKVVPGVFPYRNEIISVHDLAPFLDKGTSNTEPQWGLIVEIEKTRHVIVCDEVVGVEDVFLDQLQPPPLTLSQFGPIFEGLYKDQLLLLKPVELFRQSQFSHSGNQLL